MPAFIYKHLIVVHGIGNHAPNETAFTFMNEFVRNLPGAGRFEVQVDNLIADADDIVKRDEGDTQAQFRPSIVRLNEYKDEKRSGDPINVYLIGFSEVYWTPITKGYEDKNGGPPIPIATWARSVGIRMIGPAYYQRLWTEAIDNLESLLGLVHRTAILFKKSGELAKLLDRFLGDVQMYAERYALRGHINDCFHGALRGIPFPSRYILHP